jgi:divalent metal cation (Fe/Co/Zn/Cd) transporter
MTDQHDLQAEAPSDEPVAESKGGLAALFIALAVLGLGVAIGFAVIRAILGSRPSDPTTERIQSLIDEANRLLKELDDKKPA